MSLQSLLRWLLPREDHFFDFLERQAHAAHQAATVLARFRDATPDPVRIRDEVRNIEHEGDVAVHDMLDALAKTFVTPIDREDLQRLSKKLDDILDHLNLAARGCVVFGVEKPTAPMLVLIERIAQATRILDEAMPRLRKHDYGGLIRSAQQVLDLEKECDRIFRDEVSRLFHDPAVDAKTILREKEVLEDLEKAMNRCEQVAETFTNVAVKHA